MSRPYQLAWAVLVAQAAWLAACSDEVDGPNRPPVAVAGPDQQVRAGDFAVLNGGSSHDPDGDAIEEYRWRLLVAPAGYADALQETEGQIIQLRAEAEGLWAAALKVSDGELWSLPDLVVVRALPAGVCLSDAECDDQDPCTDDRCEESGDCTHVVNQAPCDDADGCTMQDTCDQGDCQGVPLDSDGDGFVSDACGGGDCDDSIAGIHPGAFEGPMGAEVCEDGLDNDCDGLSDQDAPGCAPCTGNQDCDDGNACTDDQCDAGICNYNDHSRGCDDANPCTDGDVCRQGACEPGEPAFDTRPCSGGSGICCSGACQTGWSCCDAVDCGSQDGCTAYGCVQGVCQPTQQPDLTPCGEGGQICCTGVCVPGSCCSHADCQNPAPICAGYHECVGCTSDPECQALDPARPICELGACVESRYCTGRLYATDKIQPGDWIRVLLTDCDRACAGSIEVDLQDNGNEWEQADLWEEGVCTGLFVGGMNTGDYPGCGFGDRDGCMHVHPGDSVNVFYDDPNSVNGQPQQGIYATTLVLAESSLTAWLADSSKGFFDSNGAPARPGDELVMEIQALNTGAPAVNVVVRDTVPAGLTYIAGSIQGCQSRDDSQAPHLEWGCSGLETGQAVTATFRVSVDSLPAGISVRSVANVGAVTADNAGSHHPFALVEVQTD